VKRWGNSECGNEKYITMHEEIMKQKWVISGPLLEVCVLSLVTEPKEWRSKYDSTKEKIIRPTISKADIIENRHRQLKTIVKKLREIDPTIVILETDDRINHEIEMLDKDKAIDRWNYLDMKALINIGHERKGRIMIRLLNENIIETDIMYVDDDYGFKHTRELKKLMNKVLISTNGICGSIGHENNLSFIIQTKNLDHNYSSFYDVKWNRKVKYYL